MMRFTTKGKGGRAAAGAAHHVLLARAGAALFWLLVWQAASALLDKEYLLPSPLATLRALGALAATRGFWLSVGGSFLKIVAGFLGAMAAGTLLAGAAYKSFLARALLDPAMAVVKSTPVASFIILALLWLNAESLSLLISLLMGLPIAYTNVYRGLAAADGRLLEMARVFRVGPAGRLGMIYLPAVAPFFASACSLAVGMCWKASVAAEVIGQSPHTVGGRLYEAKIFLNTGEMFAWTLVILLISLAFEKLVLLLTARASALLEGR